MRERFMIHASSRGFAANSALMFSE